MFSFATLQSWFLATLFLGLFVQAAPMAPTKRQLGDLQCNIARGEIVADILAMQSTVSTLAKQVSTDPTNAALVSTAQSGIKQAESSIGNIAASILTGQQASADDRDGVEAGLGSVLSALSNITSTDSTVTSTVTKALGQLQKATAAGDGVLSNCN